MQSDEPLNDFGGVPEFELVERNGEAVTLGDLIGQVWVANLIFTHCGGTCPMMSVQMRSLQSVLPDAVRFVSITVDPARDTPEVLTEYANVYGADPERWLFLTGARDDIYRLSQEGFSPGGGRHLRIRNRTDYSPAPAFVLVDQQGRIRNYYDGTTQDSHALIEDDVRTLLAGAG